MMLLKKVHLPKTMQRITASTTQNATPRIALGLARIKEVVYVAMSVGIKALGT